MIRSDFRYDLEVNQFLSYNQPLKLKNLWIIKHMESQVEIPYAFKNYAPNYQILKIYSRVSAFYMEKTKDVFRILWNIYDGVFLWKHILKLKKKRKIKKKYFRKKAPLDAWQSLHSFKTEVPIM